MFCEIVVAELQDKKNESQIYISHFIINFSQSLTSICVFSMI